MKNILIILSILSIAFCACKKNNDSNSVTQQITQPRLKKVVALDTTAAAPNDTLRVENYSFDNSGRVILQDVYGVDAGGYYTETSNYLYNGTDTLPVKTMMTRTMPADTIISTTFHSYADRTRNNSVDSTITLWMDVTGTSADTFVMHYTYTGNTVEIIQDSYTSWGGHSTLPTVTRQVTRQNGNITYEHTNFLSGAAEDYNCTYDLHPNPYYNISWIYYPTIPNTNEFYPYVYGLNNNVTEINNSYAPASGATSVNHYKYYYQYGADGYPTQVIIEDQGSTTPGSLNKIFYTYF